MQSFILKGESYMKKNFLRRLSILFVLGSSTLLSSCGTNELSNDRLIIGMETAYQPFNWTEKVANDYTLPIYKTSEYADGYDIQIAKYLSNKLNKEVEIHRMTWGALIPGIKNNEINMVLAGMSITSERLEEIDFTDPYLESDLAFLIKKENIPEGNSSENPLSYDELKTLFNGKNLICQANVVGDSIIDDYFVSYGANHLSPSLTYPAAAEEVNNGRAFAMPAELPVIEAMTNLDTTTLGVLYCDYKSFLSSDDITGLAVNIGIKKGNTELKDELNAALSELSDEERSEMMGAASIRSASNA